MPSAIASPLPSPSHSTAQSGSLPAAKPPTRLKLTMNASNQQPQTSPPATSTPTNDAVQASTPGTPERPSYSPVTPVLSHSALPASESFSLPPAAERSQFHSTPASPWQPEAPRHSATWIDPPDPVPVNLDENTDAIALRSAISILQLQRAQGIRDIRALDRMKRLAKERPQDFLQDLQLGKLDKAAVSTGIQLDPDIGDGGNDDDDVASRNAGSSALPETDFGQLPTPQNVVRAPPVEWAKYHVVGEPLEKLHEQQRQRPGVVEYDLNGSEILHPKHAVAAPLDPFHEKVQNPPLSGTHQARGSQGGSE